MKVDGIVLAAGLSSRCEKYKLALGIEGKTVIEKCIEPMYDICSSIIVVGGYNYNIISRILEPYNKVKIVLNKNYTEGMFSSVKEGLKYLNEERFFLIPGDYPLIKKDTYIKMLSINKDIVVPVYKNIKGHPVLIKSCFINCILSGHYASLREVILEHGFSHLSVDDEGILLDIDTEEDYINIINKISPC